MSRTDRLHLLSLDLRTAPPKVGAALQHRRPEVSALLRRAAAELDPLELVVVADRHRLEIYGADPGWYEAFRFVLRAVMQRIGFHASFGATRVVEAHGVAVATHLMRVAVGLETRAPRGVEPLASINVAATLAAEAHVLGSELATVFTFAAKAGRRALRETAFNAVDGSRARRELEALAVQRLVDEELSAWKRWCARYGERAAPAAEEPVDDWRQGEFDSCMRLKVGKRSVA